jgi:hypothetical protein
MAIESIEFLEDQTEAPACDGNALALVLLSPTMPARRMRRQMALAMRRTLPTTSLVIFGPDDHADGLGSIAGLWSTGTFGADDVARLSALHDIGAVLVLDREVIHGHPVIEAFRTIGLPVSFIDDIGESEVGGSLHWIRRSVQHEAA